MQETRVRSPGWEDSLEKGMAPHSSTLAWRIPWTEEPCGLHSMGLQRVGHNWKIIEQQEKTQKRSQQGSKPAPTCVLSSGEEKTPLEILGIRQLTQIYSLNSCC